jgi:molybdopterin/thiamine biosynthesis adenylyltransferase
LDLSRNWGLISPETQEKIKRATILCAGCGLGALIAEVATRIGFENFILADGDTVTESNLNRQPFFADDVGENKAKVTAKLIKHISPATKVEVVPQFLHSRDDMAALVAKSDFVINTVDPGEAFWELTEITRSLRKVELHPLNAGWWSFVYVSLPDSPPLEEILGGKVYGYELYQRLINLAPQIDLPQVVIKRLSEVIAGKLPFPQIATTSAVTAAIVVNAIVEYLEKGKLEKNTIAIKTI